jgi:hypothetical protein
MTKGTTTNVDDDDDERRYGYVVVWIRRVYAARARCGRARTRNGTTK